MSMSTGTRSRSTPFEWYERGFKRQDKAIIAALLAAWTGLPFALYLAAVGFFVGAILGAIGATAHSSSLGIFGTIVGSPGGGVLGALVGAVAGTVGGLLLIYYALVTHPLWLAGALVSGVLVSAAIFWLMDNIETWLMEFRGYRRPSRREQEKLNPLVKQAGTLMGLPFVPRYWINESKKPGAWMHLNNMVLTRGMLGDYDASEDPPKPDLDDAALIGIIAHELNHWQQADVVGLQMITACFMPFVVLYNVISWVKLQSTIAGLIGWMFFWPVWICSKLIVAPLSAHASRQAEFAADARAASLGDQYRLGLRRALTELSMWEVPRNGWEAVLSATHPPTELRLEKLEQGAPLPPPPDVVTDGRGTRPRRQIDEPVQVTKPPLPVRPAKPKPRKEPKPEPVVVDEDILELPEDEYLERWQKEHPAEDDGQWST